MAFSDELQHRWPNQVTIARPRRNRRLDRIWRESSPAATATVYCCGPASMTEEVAAHVPAARLHIERFTPARRADRTSPQANRGSLQPQRHPRSRLGEPVAARGTRTRPTCPCTSSCREGVCGACEVRVLAGRAEHLDSVADNKDKDTAGIMYPCVSRAHTPTLTLDI